jgi:hypothetical protein
MKLTKQVQSQRHKTNPQLPNKRVLSEALVAYRTYVWVETWSWIWRRSHSHPRPQRMTRILVSHLHSFIPSCGRGRWALAAASLSGSAKPALIGGQDSLIRIIIIIIAIGCYKVVQVICIVLLYKSQSKRSLVLLDYLVLWSKLIRLFKEYILLDGRRQRRSNAITTNFKIQ